MATLHRFVAVPQEMAPRDCEARGLPQSAVDAWTRAFGVHNTVEWFCRTVRARCAGIHKVPHPTPENLPKNKVKEAPKKLKNIADSQEDRER